MPAAPFTCDVPHVGLDIETVSLDAFLPQPITQLAWVRIDPDGSVTEKVAYPEHSLEGAQDVALELTRYWDTIAKQPTRPLADILPEMAQDMADATVVGAVPHFDAMRIEMALNALGLQAPWHHRLVDVESMCLPLLGLPGSRPMGLSTCAKELGVPYDQDVHHDALYDAHLALNVYAAAFERAAAMRTPVAA